MAEERHCVPMFKAAFITSDKRWEGLKCPPTDEWINRMQPDTHWKIVHLEEKKEDLTCYIMSEDIMLNAISQPQNDKSQMVPLLGNI